MLKVAIVKPNVTLGLLKACRVIRPVDACTKLSASKRPMILVGQLRPEICFGLVTARELTGPKTARSTFQLAEGPSTTSEN